VFLPIADQPLTPKKSKHLLHVVEIELNGIKTVSGIRHWHLSVPGWIEVCGKERKRGKRLWSKEIQKAFDERTMEQKRKDTIKRDREKVVMGYANPATVTETTATHNHATQGNTNTMESAIAEVIQKRRKLGVYCKIFNSIYLRIGNTIYIMCWS